MTQAPYTQPRSRKFILGLGTLMCGLVIYWADFFRSLSFGKLIPASLIVIGLLFILPKVGAFLTWVIQQKQKNP